MDNATIRFLNQLTTAFYDRVAPSFHQTRSQEWGGWHRLSKYFQEKKSATVLDIGCGNARLYTFLQTINPTLTYIGAEHNAYLMVAAKKTAPNSSFLSCDLIEAVLNDTVPAQLPTADYICLFGVLHHIPARRLRQKLLTDLCAMLSDDGYIIISLWQINKDRFQKKALDPLTLFQTRTDLATAKHHATQLEPNDILLGWKEEKNIGRLCHYTNQHEIQELANKAGLRIADMFFADGKTNDLNAYVVLKKRVCYSTQKP